MLTFLIGLVLVLMAPTIFLPAVIGFWIGGVVGGAIGAAAGFLFTLVALSE